MQIEEKEKKTNIIIESTPNQPQEKKEDKTKLLKTAVEKYPFKIKKKMSNKEVFSSTFSFFNFFSRFLDC